MSQQEFGEGRRELCVARSYITIPPGLKLSLKNTMTPEDKDMLAGALNASQNTDMDDLLVLWEIVQGTTKMLIELANLFRNADRADISTLIERYI